MERAASTSTARRRRPALSCVRCRRRKIKCDRGEPCGPCVLVREECVYKILETGRGAVGRVTPTTAAVAAGPERNAARSGSLSREGTPRWDGAGTENEVTAGAHSDGEGEGAELSVSRNAVRSAQINTRADKKRTLRWSTGMEWSSEFADIIACFLKVFNAGDIDTDEDGETVILIREIRELMKQCKETARYLKLDRPSSNPSYLHFDLTPPQRGVADIMVGFYFDHFESAYRILHVPSFWADYRSFWAAPEQTKPSVRFEVLLVIAIGCVLCKEEQLAEPLRGRLIGWIYAAQVWLSGLIEKDRLEIIGIQVHCLTLLAQQVCAVGGDLPWVSTGMLVHKAMQMCLHRSPRMLPAMSCLEAEIRRRLWATILELVVQSSFDAMMPPRMSLDDFDIEAPANVNDNDLHGAAGTLQSAPKATYTDTSVQLLLYESLPTRLRIVQLLNGLGSKFAYSDALTLTSEIMEALQALVNLAHNLTSRMIAFQRNVVDLILRRALIPLHRPFVDKAKDDHRYHYSVSISLDAALAITNPHPDESFERLLRSGVGFWRESFWYATCVVTERAIADTLLQQRDGTFDRDSDRREMLKGTLATLLRTSIGRLHLSDTNVKSHMFLSMVMGQIEALEQFSSTEDKILKAMKESLFICPGILELRKRKYSAIGIGVDRAPIPDDYPFPDLDTDFEWEAFFE